MLRVLQRVVGTQTVSGSHGYVAERLRSNREETFKGIVGTTPIVSEGHKLKDIVSLLKEAAYC